VEGEVEVPATSAMILVKTGEGTPTDPSEPSDPTDPSDPAEPADPDAVNKTALKAAIDKAKALKKADYSNKSFEAMKSALAVAEKIYAKEDATQTEVDNALKALNAAIKALVPSTGKNPETGDSFQMTLFVTMAALSLMGGAALVLNRKKFF
jgi:beta-L-arabinobiosidase